MGIVNYVVEKPQALSIIFALLLIGMLIGVVPSALQTDVNTTEKKVDQILINQQNNRQTADTRYANLQQSIQDANNRSDAKMDQLIKIMRGSCLLQAKLSNDSAALSYCNP